MRGLNLSNFKKLKSDAKTTTLKHPEGHSIVIAHKPLSDKMKKELHALPFADGGDVQDSSPAIDPSKVGGDVTTSGDPIVNAVSTFFGGDKKAKGGEIEDPTQRNLLPGDKDPNKIEKQVVSQAKSRMYDEGGYVDTIDSDDPIVKAVKRAPASEDHSGTPNSEPTPENKNDTKYKQQAADFNRQLAPEGSYAEGGRIGSGKQRHDFEKGVNKSLEETDDPKYGSWQRRSQAGDDVSDEKVQRAKDSHHRVLGQQLSMKKPSLYSEGGMIEQCRCDEMVGDNPKCKQHANKKIQKYADGTDNVQDVDIDNPGRAPEPMQDAPEPQQVAASDMPQAQPPMSATSQSQPAQAPNMSELDGPQPSSAPGQAADAPGIKDQLSEEDKAWQNDLYNGHVKPETYKSLFDKKDTLGKIGTVFGLLLGGMAGKGNGNAALDIMSTQIKNDLEAQKTSKSNAQNFLRLNQQNLMNNAQINQLVKQGKLTESEAKNVMADANIKATALAHTQMNWSAFHDLTQKIQALPQGSPQRAAGEQQLSMLANQISNENYNIMDRAEAASALSKSFNGTSPGADSEQQFQAQNRSLRLGGQGKLADDREARHIPGIPGQATSPVNETDKKTLQAMNILDNKGKDVLDFVKKNSGSWNPQTRAVAAQKIEEMKNFYNDSIKGGSLTQGRLGWYDEQFAKNPTDILSQIMGSTAKLKEMVNSNANRRDQLLSGPGGLGYPKQEGSKDTAKDNTSMSKSGRQMIQRNGKWYYK